MRFLSVLFLLITTSILSAQIITSEPTFPTENDSIIIYYDATEGDQGLMGYAGDDVYAHTGVITNYSSAWDYVVADWDENIPKAQLSRVSADLYRLVIGFPREYYALSDPDENILQLAFVFRNSNGSVTGRDVGGADIFYDLYEPGINVVLLEPEIDYKLGDYALPSFTEIDDTVTIQAISVTPGLKTDSLNLYINGDLIFTTSDDTLSYNFIAADYGTGIKHCIVVGKDTASLSDSVSFKIAVNPAITDLARPVGNIDGINYDSDTQVTLSLFAPYKSFVYVLGDFNDWKVNTSYYMNREEVDSDSVHWWITIDGLIPGDEYAFQYLVDGVLRIADPYTEKVLDPWHDQEIIDKGLYPDLKPYPEGKTTEPVAVLQTNQTDYNWQHAENFIRPAKHDLIIYELLIRDFVQKHDYSTLIDTLDYLENLGINAIELMPINEFEGNSSWGYNPSFYFAPDKFYGPAETLKQFVDECHYRNIAVIIDMVLNHSYGQSPLVRLYFKNGNPTTQNPWYNVVSPNPVFSWGYDFDHESVATKSFVDRVNAYWLKEFKVDGFRFDFTKGFTNTSGDGDKYDINRVNILKRMADKIWETDSTAYVILEHFTVNDEERDLTHYKRGMMVWGNANYNYNEATMGYHENGKSDFSWGYYNNRSGWTEPNLVTYMESHDEERLMFKNLTYGNGSGNYQIQQLEIALNRIKMAGAFFFTYPGAKMIWQFGELGYDVSIDDPCRVCEKPILWEYYQDELRQKLYKTFAALIKLRRSELVFHDPSANTELSVATSMKRIRSAHFNLKTIIIGNFGINTNSINPLFYSAGTWYDYFSGDSIIVTDVSEEITLKPGEFHIYTDRKLETPEDDILNPEVVRQFNLAQNYPNPFNLSTTIEFELAQSSLIQIKIYDILGREVTTLLNDYIAAGRYELIWDGKNRHGISVSSGMFIYEIQVKVAGQMLFHQSRKMVLLR